MKPKVYFSLDNCPNCNIPWMYDQSPDTSVGHHYYYCPNYPKSCTFTHRRNPRMILTKAEFSTGTVYWNAQRPFCGILPSPKGKSVNVIPTQWLDHRDTEEETKLYITFS